MRLKTRFSKSLESLRPSKDSQMPKSKKPTDRGQVASEKVRSKKRAAAGGASAPAASEESQAPEQDAHASLMDRFFRGFPSWGISAVVHALIIIVLGLYTIGPPQNIAEVFSMLASAEDAEPVDTEELLDVEIEVDTLDSQQVELQDPGLANFGELSLASADVLEVRNVGEMMAASDNDLASLLSRDGRGLGEAGEGLGGATTFFGVRSKGRRFMYVVDNSNSMGNGKFETACFELMKSVSQLGPKQQFYVIFFSDTAYPLFYPKSAKDWVPATSSNQVLFEAWLKTIELCLQTRGEEAMERAFTMKPDVLYLLGDGAFTDKTAQRTLSHQDSRVTVHTLGFGMREKSRESFEAIAARFRGKFHEVAVTPQMRQLDQMNKRPRNRSQHGVWGIKLGAGKPPRKK
jgi:hypothetical protein